MLFLETLFVTLLQVLRRTKGAFQLVDVSGDLPELRRLPGLQRWRVRDRNTFFDTWEQGKEVRMGALLCIRATPAHAYRDCSWSTSVARSVRSGASREGS